MDFNEISFKKLLHKYEAGQCSQEEIALLESWYLNLNEDNKVELSVNEFQETKTESWQNIKERIIAKPVLMFQPSLMAAACALVFLTFGILFYNYKSNLKDHQKNNPVSQRIRPGSNKASLILSDGKSIVLTDRKTSLVATEFGVTIVNTSDGNITHREELTNTNIGSGYNTLKTPNGGQYKIQLPDGSEVWLNAASKLIFPASFKGQKQRQVQLTGEAYFEVAKDKEHPFIVKTEKEAIEVLGTHFNVSSYADDQSTKTTLVEGSVKVNSLNALHSAILKPGQQAVLTGDKFSVAEANTEQAIAWKEGYFNFQEDLESIMQKLARWYDVEIVYQIDRKEPIYFGGKISRSKNLSAVLKIIESTQSAHFKVEGRRVIVTK